MNEKLIKQVQIGRELVALGKILVEATQDEEGLRSAFIEATALAKRCGKLVENSTIGDSIYLSEK